MVGAKFGRQFPRTPVRRAIPRFLSGHGQNLRFELGSFLAGDLATMTTEKPRQPLLTKAFEPKSHCVDAASHLPTDSPSRLAARQQQDNFGALHLLGSCAPGPD